MEKNWLLSIAVRKSLGVAWEAGYQTLAKFWEHYSHKAQSTPVQHNSRWYAGSLCVCEHYIHRSLIPIHHTWPGNETNLMDHGVDLTVWTVAKVTVPNSSLSSHGSWTPLAPRASACWKKKSTKVINAVLIPSTPFSLVYHHYHYILSTYWPCTMNGSPPHWMQCL